MLVISHFNFTSIQVEIGRKGLITNVAFSGRLECSFFGCIELSIQLTMSIQEITDILDIVFQLIHKMFGDTMTSVQTKSGKVAVVGFVLTMRTFAVMYVIGVRVRFMDFTCIDMRRHGSIVRCVATMVRQFTTCKCRIPKRWLNSGRRVRTLLTISNVRLERALKVSVDGESGFLCTLMPFELNVLKLGHISTQGSVFTAISAMIPQPLCSSQTQLVGSIIKMGETTFTHIHPSVTLRNLRTYKSFKV